MEISLNPSRLRLARARRGLSITALADAVGITSKMISNYENGHSETPRTNTLNAIAENLRYPIEFFTGHDIEPLDAETVSFRSLKRMKASQREAAIASGQIALIFNYWLEENFELPINFLPDLSGMNPEIAAISLRSEWGLGVLAIKNMVHLLESKGVRIFSLFENNNEVDAFSFWKDKNPFIFLNSLKSGERSRFDAAHELGHLILHKHGTRPGRESEIEADRFASAFLMPEESVKSKCRQFPPLESILKLKKNWRVSAAALVRRLKDIELITEWHYRTLNIEMSKLGYLRKEPDGIEREKSSILEKIIRSLWNEGITTKHISQEIKIPLDELEKLLFGLIESRKNDGANDKSISKIKLNIIS